MVKTIYNYHPLTKEYLDSCEADPSPLEPGKFLIPSDSTELPPPIIPNGKAAIFNGSWILVDDFRGQSYWLNGIEHKIMSLGITPPVESTTSETNSQKRERAWSYIKAERDRRIQSGGYKVGSKWFHSDTFSRTQQMGLVMMGANIPAGTPWKTMDGSTVTMTQTLAGQIFGTAAASDISIFAAAEAHRVAMEASADPATYDFSTGWPKAFGE